MDQLYKIHLGLNDYFDKTFIEMLDNGFQWVGLRQPDYSKPCGCKTNQEGITEPANCNRCFRTGYVFTDYLVAAYLWQSALGFEFRSEAGLLSTQRNNMVLKHDRPVNKGDVVFVMDVNTDTGQVKQPFRILRAFVVQDVLALRGKNTRVEFWKCALEERTVDDYRPNQVGTGFKYKGDRSFDRPE